MGDGTLLASEEVLSDEFSSDPWGVVSVLCYNDRIVLRTVRSLSSFGVERASCLSTIVLLNLSGIPANDLVFLCKARRDSEFMEPGLAPQMLFPDPTTFHKITLTFLNASAVRMVEMSLSPQNLSVGVSAGMGDDAHSQEGSGQSLCEVDHFD
jgi:hypothetical protein